jgi:membrane-bound serine protease (ClpP class)
MAPGSVIGDAMPILMSPTGGPQEMPEAMQEKSVSAVAALVRSTAQLKGHDPQLAEKMVRREIEYKIDDEIISPAGQLLTLTNVEAERLVGPEQRRLLSAGTVKDIAALLETIGKADVQTRELQVTTAERVARYIATLAPFFLMAGLLGIYIEFKTPGFGLPGILGLISLALFFWGHHIAGLTGMEDIVIFLIGLMLVIVEILFLPGFGVIGITGACMMLWALLNAMVQKFPGGPWYPTLPELQIPLFKLTSGIVLAGIGAVLAGRYLPRTSLFHSRLVLDEATSRQAGYTASSPTPELVGLEGVVDMALHPAGTALFGDRRFDVITRGEYIAQGTRVTIVETHGNRIIVEASGS